VRSFILSDEGISMCVQLMIPMQCGRPRMVSMLATTSAASSAESGQRMYSLEMLLTALTK